MVTCLPPVDDLMVWESGYSLDSLLSHILATTLFGKAEKRCNL